MDIKSAFLKSIEERKKNYRIQKKYQLMGLEIADILSDRKHKALYIKLAKEFGPENILRIAKDVAERKKIVNKGAYFMKVLAENKKNKNGNRN